MFGGFGCCSLREVGAVCHLRDKLGNDDMQWVPSVWVAACFFGAGSLEGVCFGEVGATTLLLQPSSATMTLRTLAAAWWWFGGGIGAA